MPKPRPDAEVIDLLERWLDAAQRGTLRDVVLVGRFADGECQDDWQVDEASIDEMAVELRSTVIRLQTLREQIAAITEH